MTLDAILVDLCSDLLSHGTPVRFVAPGHSMTPTIRDGDVIEVEPASGAEMKPDDIVLYRGPRGSIAHRIVAIERTGGRVRIIPRGDASNTLDEPVGPDAVLGRVIAVVREGSRVSLVGRRARMRRQGHLLRARLRRLLGFALGPSRSLRR
jgi:signal peptidase I